MTLNYGKIKGHNYLKHTITFLCLSLKHVVCPFKEQQAENVVFEIRTVYAATQYIRRIPQAAFGCGQIKFWHTIG